MKKSVNGGLKAIAIELGVSTNTVSRALRDCSDISETLKQKVREIAIKNGYMPNIASQYANHDKRFLVALVIPDFKNLYFGALAGALNETFMNKEDYNLTFIFANKSYLDGEVIKQCVLQRVDVVLSTNIPTQDAIDSAKLYEMNIVVIGPHYQSTTDLDVVYTDDKMGIELAARYLVKYHNIDKFIYIGPYIKNPSSINNKTVATINKLRQETFFETINNICDTASIKKFNKNHENQNDVYALYELIKTGYLGIFFYNDTAAYSWLKSLNSICHNIRLLYPNLHLVGFDCLASEYDGLYSITSIKIDYVAFSNSIFEVVKNRLENPKLEQQVVSVPVTLLQRNNNKETEWK